MKRLCKHARITFLIILILIDSQSVQADDGYRLWLKYDLIRDAKIRDSYKRLIQKTLIIGNSSVMNVVETDLYMAVHGILGR